VPTATILIENPIAVLKTTHNPVGAQAFVDYLRAPDGQRLWARPAIARCSGRSVGVHDHVSGAREAVPIEDLGG